MEQEQKILVYHVRDENKKRVGTVVAIDAVNIGWSQCSPKDRFNKHKGTLIARGRAAKGSNARMREDETADLIRAAIGKMQERATRYFK